MGIILGEGENSWGGRGRIDEDVDVMSVVGWVEWFGDVIFGLFEGGGVGIKNGYSGEEVCGLMIRVGIMKEGEWGVIGEEGGMGDVVCRVYEGERGKEGRYVEVVGMERWGLLEEKRERV